MDRFISDLAGTKKQTLKIGSAYTAPTLDREAAPKKYVDDSSVNKFTVTISHSFVSGDVGKPIAKVGSSYALAKADSAANVEVVGFLVSQTTGSFVIQQTGKIQQTGAITRTAHGFAGPAIWLSDATAGALTETAPTTAGHFLKPVAKVIDANTLEIVDYPATEIVAAGTYSTTFTSSDSRITAGVLTVTHGLGQRPLFVTMMDGSGNPVDVYPAVTYTSTSAFTVDLSAMTITGTWSLLASKGAGAAVAAGGMWDLVERKSFTSAATSYTFSGLDGNSARRYKFVCRIISATAGNSDLYVRPQADSGSNYQSREMQAYGTNALQSSSQALTYAPISLLRQTGTVALIRGEIDAATGCYRLLDNEDVQQNDSTSLSTVSRYATLWKDSATNITSLQFAVGDAKIGVGSYIELWKLGA
jgi:hypothetical protein